MRRVYSKAARVPRTRVAVNRSAISVLGRQVKTLQNRQLGPVQSHILRCATFNTSVGTEMGQSQPPPPPRSPKRKAPATPVEPDSPGLPARKAAKSTTAEWKKIEQFAAQAMRRATTAFYECAGKLFDGQMKRVDRLEKKKPPANDPRLLQDE